MGTLHDQQFDIRDDEGYIDSFATYDRVINYARDLIDESGATKKIISANMLEMGAVSTGYEGGDNGCVSAFYIKDCGGTNWRIAVMTDDYLKPEGLCVVLEGDYEAKSIASALRWIAGQIEKQAKDRAK